MDRLRFPLVFNDEKYLILVPSFGKYYLHQFNYFKFIIIKIHFINILRHLYLYF